MGDLISRSALGIGKCNPDVFEDKGYANGWNSAIEIIEAAPAVDAVEVVHGRWVQSDLFAKYHWMYNCSCCSAPVYDPAVPPNYCPNCGAKMDGERKDNV